MYNHVDPYNKFTGSLKNSSSTAASWIIVKGLDFGSSSLVSNPGQGHLHVTLSHDTSLHPGVYGYPQI